MAPTAYADGGGDVSLPYLCHLSVTELHAGFKYTDRAILRQHKLLSGDEDRFSDERKDRERPEGTGGDKKGRRQTVPCQGLTLCSSLIFLAHANEVKNETALPLQY